MKISPNSTPPPQIDLDAEFYIQHCDLQHTLASDLLNAIEFHHEAKILDIGCGDGSLTNKVAQKVFNGTVVGIDASPSMIELASKMHPKSSYPNLSFLLTKAEDVHTFAGYDYIVSFSCFHWVREGKSTFSKICQDLEPGSELLFLTYPHESKYYEFMQKALLKTFPEFAHLSAYNTMLSINDYSSTLNEQGINVKVFQKKELYTTHATMDDLRSFIKGWLASFVPLPEELHTAYLDAVLQECLPYAKYDSDGFIKLPYTELIIRAEKIK